MIDLKSITVEDLIRFGIIFRSQEEAVLFTEYIIEELEVRVGSRISKSVSENDIAVFEQLTDQQEQVKWLQEYCPSYKNYIEEEQEYLAFDILKNRYYLDDIDIEPIPGIGDPLENLEISQRHRKLMKEAHISTIEDFLLSKDKTLDRRLRGMNLKRLIHVIVKYLFDVSQSVSKKSDEKKQSIYVTDEQKEFYTEDEITCDIEPKVGRFFNHPKYGFGEILSISENKDKSIATVDFGKSMGQKTLLVDWIKANCICFDEF